MNEVVEISKFSFSEMQHLHPILRNVFETVGGALGLNIIFATFLSLQISNLLVAAIFKQVRSPDVRKLISLVVGITWCLILYDKVNTLILLVLSTKIYYVCKLRLLSPAYVTILAIIILSYFHISRMMTDYLSWTLDITGPLMLMTAKLTAFSFDLDDGRRFKKAESLSSDPHVAEQRMKSCVAECPSLFEYYAFAFDFIGIISGPIFGLREYLDFIYLRNDFAGIGNVHFVKVILERFSYAVVLGGLFSLVGTIPALSFEYYYSKEYVESGFFWRLFMVHLITTAHRLKYYFAWYTADVAGLIAGIGYNPTNRDKFSRSQNAIFSRVEFANSQAEAMSKWNISISNWLRCNIYLRAREGGVPSILKGKIGERQFATILTRFVSAFWHGFYPGYYLAFLSTVFQFEADSVARKYIKPLFMKADATKPHWFYTLFGKLHTAYCLQTYGAAFLVLSASASIHIWSSLYYGIHILNIGEIILIPIVCKKIFKVKTPPRTPPNEKKSL
jgi:lysophospholipid acyltransferase